MDAETVELARHANVALGTALFSYCCYRLVRDWKKWTRRERAVRVHLSAYLFVITVGTALLLWDIYADARVFLVLGVHLSFAAALFRNRNDPVDDRAAKP